MATPNQQQALEKVLREPFQRRTEYLSQDRESRSVAEEMRQHYLTRFTVPCGGGRRVIRKRIGGVD